MAGTLSFRPNSYVHTSPYNGCWLQFYWDRIAENLCGRKVITEADLRQVIETAQALPELLIAGNFIVERAGVTSLCRELGINIIHSEDGFFPHYETMHGDPVGFSWESSLSSLVFRRCSGRQKRLAQAARKSWLEFAVSEIPPVVRPPFVLWPLQIIADRVNRWDLNVSTWGELIAHFRMSLPEEIQLVVKEHPKNRDVDFVGLNEMLRDLPNTVMVARSVSLKSLLSRCAGAAGANSSVLYEARLMFRKPTYVYARSWYTNHGELFMPVEQSFAPRPLNRLDYLCDASLLCGDRLDDYSDWFLSQLLVRQITKQMATQNPAAFRSRVERLSYRAYAEYGEDIFEPAD